MAEQPRKRATIMPPDSMTVLAARHLDATEGPVQVGATVDASTRSAITRVLDYIATAHNAPPAAGEKGATQRPCRYCPDPLCPEDCPECGAPIHDLNTPKEQPATVHPDPELRRQLVAAIKALSASETENNGLRHRHRLAHQARRAKEHQLDGIRRALCDAGFMDDGDPYSHADLEDVIRQAGRLNEVKAAVAADLDEPAAGPAATEATEATEPDDGPTHGLTVQQTDTLWDAVAIPGPRNASFVEQHDRVCRAVAGLLAEATAVPEPVVLTEAEEARLAESGVHTPGCDCGHDGMGVSWHGDDCPWRRSILGGSTPASGPAGLREPVLRERLRQAIWDADREVDENALTAVLNALRPTLAQAARLEPAIIEQERLAAELADYEARVEQLQSRLDTAQAQVRADGIAMEQMGSERDRQRQRADQHAATLARVRNIPRLPHSSQQTGELGRAYTRGWESVISALDTALNQAKEQPAEWTPPPPGNTREQLPETMLALIRDRLPDYLSTACQTADTLACTATYPESGVPRPLYDEIREHAERLHERCRLNNKFTGQLCACGCHQPKEQPTTSICTATIESPHTGVDGPVQCSRPAHDDSQDHESAPQDPHGRGLYWSDQHTGATPHRASREERE